MKTEVKALFKKFNANDKKDVIEFELKGDLSGDQLLALHKLKGGQVFVKISSSQMDMDDLDEDEHDGIQYSVGGDGVVAIAPDQMSIDDVPQQGGVDEQGSDEDVIPEEPQEQQDETGSEPVTPENASENEQEPKRRGRPRKTDTPPTEESSANQDELPPADPNDEDLPF
ncbi:hypothetical protein [Brevibacillus sp. HD3.3A]|uniref:hypothetical protein n=1 Tax=Brevibacillus sp. HD3.3A TaxID=2738979 RepID=UPI00156B15E5|nr:hypothetical protein [Brevibacillus sp. HD3.3A]UED70761.1 hypothetical protein HP435_09020 [Brevibacillus sp. HD3.3A]